jgi:hypothetical protein
MRSVLKASFVFTITAWLPVATEAVPVRTIQPLAWGILADGGDGPIDGKVDFIEINQRVAAGFSDTLPETFHGLMEFDVRQLSDSAAFLNLRVYHATVPESGQPETLPFQLYRYVGDGRITSSDFSAGILFHDFVLSSTLSPPGHVTVDPKTVSVDVSSFVVAALANGDRFLGFNIRPNGDPFTNETVYFFGTPREGRLGTSTLGELNGVVVPEPTTLLLFGTTMAGLGLARLRRWRQKQL